MTISDAIRYVGVNDTDIDLFESQYPVPHGVSYNSYLLLDDKIALLDTVDKRKYDDWAAKVDAVLDGRTPDYIVVHHLEPDHAGSLQMTIEKYPEATLVLSAKALAMLPQFFDLPAGTKTLSVKEGDTLELGHHTLTFVMAPMVHWPEVMVSYEQTEKVLFSADAFGKFGAVGTDEPWPEEARRYFINIVGKYGAPVQTLLKKAAALDIATICPLHGPVLQGDLTPYLHLYNLEQLSAGNPGCVHCLYLHLRQHEGGCSAAGGRTEKPWRNGGNRGLKPHGFGTGSSKSISVQPNGMRRPQL